MTTLTSASNIRERRAARNKKLIVTVALSFFLLYTLAPLFYLVVAATKSERELFTTFGLWFGTEFKVIENLQFLFTYENGIYLTWFWNTVWYSTVSAVGAAVMAMAAGYALAKFRFRGRGVVFAIILGAVMVPQTALVIPIFLLLSKVGLVDTPFAVIGPSLVFPLGVYLMRIYAEEGIPNEMLEAARIDGASEFRIFISIATRLLGPGFVTVLLLAFVSSWNNYFLPLVVLSSPQNYPLTVGLTGWYTAAVTSATAAGKPVFTMVMMGTLIGIVPIIIAFLSLQRFWRAGITSGAVK